jgi:hypothetical protein
VIVRTTTKKFRYYIFIFKEHGVNNKERLELAERVKKSILRNKLPKFWFNNRRDKSDKEPRRK